jgi:hypothetical protein
VLESGSLVWLGAQIHSCLNSTASNSDFERTSNHKMFALPGGFSLKNGQIGQTNLTPRRMFYDCPTPIMKDKFALRSRLQVEGVFWDATRPDDKFSGTLSCDGKHLELVTRAELYTPEPSQIFGLEQSPAPDIVHGYTSIGDCTLIGFQEIGSPGRLDIGTGVGVRWHNFRVTGACLTGWHLPSDTANVLTSADLTYSGINEWLPGSGGLILALIKNINQFSKCVPRLIYPSAHLLYYSRLPFYD